MDKTQLLEIMKQAKAEAKKAAKEKLTEMGGDVGTCGFAWVDFYEFEGKKIDGRSKIGKLLKSVGCSQSYSRKYQVWNPAEFHTQSICILEAGADAYAEVLRKYGFVVYTGSRMD